MKAALNLNPYRLAGYWALRLTRFHAQAQTCAQATACFAAGIGRDHLDDSPKFVCVNCQRSESMSADK